jgi:cullin 1
MMPLSDEPKSNEKHLELERGAIIDAAIVRILKSRRVLSHSNLVSEIFQQISYFQPENKFVKSRIGLLMEKGYLERDESDSNLYRYLP